MPKKKTKKKGGAGKKAKKGVKAVAEKEEIKKKCSQLLKIYQQRCMAMNSTASQGICQACRECIENEKALVKVLSTCTVHTYVPVSIATKWVLGCRSCHSICG